MTPIEKIDSIITSIQKSLKYYEQEPRKFDFAWHGDMLDILQELKETRNMIEQPTVLKVRKLHWEEAKVGHCWETVVPLDGINIYYCVERYKDEFISYYSSGKPRIATLNSLEEAKAACQAHFEQLIWWCLESN